MSSSAAVFELSSHFYVRTDWRYVSTNVNYYALVEIDSIKIIIRSNGNYLSTFCLRTFCAGSNFCGTTGQFFFFIFLRVLETNTYGRHIHIFDEKSFVVYLNQFYLTVNIFGKMSILFAVAPEGCISSLV